MALVAQLLGPARVVHDGAVQAAPKGRKVWALFAYLTLSNALPSRQQLVDLLFPEADDSAGALRWNLSELRRLLGGPETVGSGNVVQLRLPRDAVVDVRVLMAGTAFEAAELAGLGSELLEGVNVQASAGFDAWLLAERRRIQGVSEAVLREAALRALASGNPNKAVQLATRLVTMDQFDEDAHALLIRSFAGAGDPEGAQKQLRASTELFRRELGVDPGPELAEAAGVRPSTPSTGFGGGRTALRALIESGEAALDAGAVASGVETLRNAVAATAEAGDRELEATACLALGTALVHAAKGKDEEGAATLHRAIAAAEESDHRAAAASAHRELGYVELLRGDYVRARVWLAAAEQLAGGDPIELAWIKAVTGTTLAEVGAHEQARLAYEESKALAEEVGDRKLVAWTLSHIGRSALMRGELDRAGPALARSRELCATERWTSYLPFPEALEAEVALHLGDIDRASESFEHAYTIGAQVDDACWEAYGIRGFALVEAARSGPARAVWIMDRALSTCDRYRDTHLWLRAYVLDALCSLAVTAEDPTAQRWVTDLGSLTARSGMQELSVHSYLYRYRMGDEEAIEGARILATSVENPLLHSMVEAGTPPDVPISA
jgi:DNA-binding SARP family transcriptional activator